MYTIKMKTIICYIAAIAFIISGIGLIYLSNQSESLYAANNDIGIEVPIIMYHSILPEPHEKSKFIVTPSGFEEDLIYLKENGYETVVMQDIINYVNGKGSLPEKPIVLSFDDGYYNNCYYVFPLLKKYNAKAVISIVGAYTDMYSEISDKNPTYAHLTWDDINEMMDSGYVEFQNHSYNLHSLNKGRNGSKKKTGETPSQYEEFLKSDLEKLQNEFAEHTGYEPKIYTYPFGSVSEASFNIIKKMGFSGSFCCEGKTNYIKKGDREGLYMLNRFIRTPQKSVSLILSSKK